MNCRTEQEFYPDFTAYIDYIKENGISSDILYKIIQRHQPNSMYNRDLYYRYKNVYGYVPIHKRQPRYEEENPINNKISSDFFGEIVDFKTGYFAGEPITYSYSDTDEAEDELGNEEAIDKAKKALSDFTVRNNMYGVDMEITKNASIYGYSGRLFYIDTDGNECVMPIHGYETIILSKTDMSSPEYAIRYYQIKDIDDSEKWIVEFYDDKNITTYEGDLSALVPKKVETHLFDYCPLQGISNNKECIGDAEKTLSKIDDYDKVVSDNSNEIESFTHAMMQIGVQITDETLAKAQKSGVIVIPQIGANPVSEPVKWVTKDVNDTFTEHHLERLEDDIYRASHTPNLSDETFGTASGEALKFKLHGLETKCAMFEANVTNSAHYMWKVLCSSWEKKGLKLNPLQFCMDFTRNFPLNLLSEAQAAQAMIGAGLPKEVAWSKLSFIDDIDYVKQLAEAEKDDVISYYDDANEELDNQSIDNDMNSQTNTKGSEKDGLQKEEEK